MWLLPYEKFYIISDLKPNEVEERLKSAIYVPDGKISDKDYDVYSIKYFTGYVNKDTFELRRNVITTRHPLPETKGKISIENDKTCIIVTIRSVFLIIFMIIVGMFIFSVFLFEEMLGHNYAKATNATTIIPLLTIIAIWGIYVLPFKAESREIKNILTTLFETA